MKFKASYHFPVPFGPPDFEFVNDNARQHVSEVLQEFIEQESIIECKAKHPNLNPIENVWGLMKRRLPRRLRAQHAINNAHDMVLDLEVWENIPINGNHWATA